MCSKPALIFLYFQIIHCLEQLHIRSGVRALRVFLSHSPPFLPQYFDQIVSCKLLFSSSPVRGRKISYRVAPLLAHCGCINLCSMLCHDWTLWGFGWHQSKSEWLRWITCFCRPFCRNTLWPSAPDPPEAVVGNGAKWWLKTGGTHGRNVD